VLHGSGSLTNVSSHQRTCHQLMPDLKRTRDFAHSPGFAAITQGGPIAGYGRSPIAHVNRDRPDIVCQLVRHTLLEALGVEFD